MLITSEGLGEGAGADVGPSLPPSHLLQVFAHAFSPNGFSHAPFPFQSSHLSDGALSLHFKHENHLLNGKLMFQYPLQILNMIMDHRILKF